MIVDKIKKRDNKVQSNKKSNIDIPIGKWVKCTKCKEIIYKETVRNNLNICPNCGNYFRMHINRRLESIIDEGTYKRFELNIDTDNPLELEDYPKKLKTLREKTKLEEAKKTLEDAGYVVKKTGNVTAISKTIITNKPNIFSQSHLITILVQTSMFSIVCRT